MLLDGSPLRYGGKNPGDFLIHGFVAYANASVKAAALKARPKVARRSKLRSIVKSNALRRRDQCRRMNAAAPSSICVRSIHSSGWCACSIEPGPQMMAGMPRALEQPRLGGIGDGAGFVIACERARERFGFAVAIDRKARRIACGV
jgi:hypothetical protein